jgi:26S proteasome regulatory subunit T3
MADVLVENPVNILAPHKRPLPSAIPNVDSLEGFPTEGADDYQTYKKLQAQLEYVERRQETARRRC